MPRYRVAVRISYTEIMFIPEQGADLSLKDGDGNSVLHAIVQQTKTEPESVDALLQVHELSRSILQISKCDRDIIYYFGNG